MATSTTSSHSQPHVSLIDEVMAVLARGERALFADLAEAAWHPQATLASLANSLGSNCDAAGPGDAA